jgi:uridine kinase
VKILKDLLLRNPVEVPVYDFVTHSRGEETIRVEPADVIIIEGILVLAMEEVRDLCHMKIFVDTDDDLRLARRLKRDTVDRGRSVDGVISQYTTFVKPMFDTFVSPSKKYADVIEARTKRPAKNLPQPHRVASELSNSRHAHDHSERAVPPRGLCVLRGPPHSLGRRARVGTLAV